MFRKNDRLVPADLYKSLDDLEIPKESIIIDANKQIGSPVLIVISFFYQRSKLINVTGSSQSL